MPRQVMYLQAPRSKAGHRAAAAIGIFLGVQLGSLTFDGHLLAIPLPSLIAGSSTSTPAGPAHAAVAPGLPARISGLPATTPDVSPWSVFTQGGGPRVAVTWAKTLLRQLGVPAGGWRLQFIWDWEVSEGSGGRYNPLNQGPVPGRPELTTTGQQYGGGAADYASWSAGLAGAYDYLHMGHYAAVLAALTSEHGTYDQATRALWASPWAGSHYGWGARWHSAPVPGA